MIGRIRRHWRQHKRSKPGRRFRDRYERRQRISRGRWDRHALVNIGLGTAISIVGIVLIPAPGPGWLVTLVGLGFLASEFAPIARSLDWLEVRVRAGVARAIAVWNTTPVLLRTVIVLMALLVVVLLGFGGYALVTNG